MIQASTDANSEAIIEQMAAPKCSAFMKVEWDDDGAWRLLEDLDVGAISKWTEAGERKAYTKHDITPLSNFATFRVLSINGRYAETSGTAYAGILKPNRKIRISGGYQVPDAVTEEYEFGLADGVIKQGIALDTGKLILAAAGVADSTPPHFQDYFAARYGAALYGAANYGAAGYWVGTYDSQIVGSLTTYNTVTVNANNARARVFFRAFNDRETYEAGNVTSASWTDLGTTINGAKVFPVTAAGFRYAQVAIVFDGTTWGSGDYVDQIALGVSTFVEYIYRSVFYLDNPAFPEPPAPEMPRVECTARDAYRKALEIPALLGDVSGLSLDAIIKSVCDQVGLKYTATSIDDLSALGLRTLTTGIEKPYKIDQVINWISQIGTQRGAGNAAIRYKTFLKYDETLRDNVLYIKPRATGYNAVFCFQSRYYLQIGNRGRSYDKQLYRITAFTKKPSVSPEETLGAQTITAAGTYTITWTGNRIYKRILASSTVGKPTIAITDVSLTSITFTIGGTFSTITITIKGSPVSGSFPAAVGENIRVEPDGSPAGQGIEIENPLLLDDAEAARITFGFLDEWGEPVNTAEGLEFPYLHLTPETDDLAALWARFIFDENLYRIRGREFSWNYIGGNTVFDLEDSGLNFSQITDFTWDDAMVYDMGMLWDMVDGPMGTSDQNDYEHLRDLDSVRVYPVPILWNKTAAESGGILTSEIGSDLTKLGALVFEDSGMDTGPFGFFAKCEADSIGIKCPAGVMGINEGCIEFWVKQTDPGSGALSRFLAWPGFGATPLAQFILLADALNTGQDYWYVSTDYLTSTYANVFIVGTVAGTEPIPLTLGAWNHFAIAWKRNSNPLMPDQVWVSVDGLAMEAAKHPSNPGVPKLGAKFSSSHAWQFGGYGSNSFKGHIDNIKVWDFAKLDFSDRHIENRV